MDLGLEKLSGPIHQAPKLQSKGIFQSVVSSFEETEQLANNLAVEDFPRGYPQVSYLLDSDDSFMMYRRFGRLHARLLLQKQDKLRELEEELFRLDKLDELDDERKLALSCREEDDDLDPPECGMSRQQIFTESERLLLEYGTLLRQANSFQEMAKPTDRDHVSVFNYFRYKEPLAETDSGFILQKNDLVTIRAGRDHAWLDSFVESFLRWYSRPLIKKFFCDEETRAKTSDPHMHYFSRTRITFVTTLMITMLISILLIVPIWILYWVTLHPIGGTGTGNILLIVVLLSFTLLFNCTLSLFTKVRRHEMLAASVG